MSHPSARVRPLLAVLPLLLLACGGDSAPAPAPAAPAADKGEGPSDPFGYYFLDADKPLPGWAGEMNAEFLYTPGD